ncbi:type II secretion system F family protein [Bradyrhizobium sp. STM 3809]|uniref:type II secretion system F family protein n=1 Tax=Bradyrhizobium sp. STM 3809 TaxID=551936 RepID=UPI0002408DDA|nr:type II secretion system F family protein [Bradyrhizobium sp. STM 3809]CCE00701.1 putative General secretion pathway protein F [Bradyrhizobium sp. STM 3809]
MPRFRYQAYGTDGAFAEGTIEAASVAAADATLWAQGLSPFQMRSLDGGGTPWWNREITLGGGAARGDLLAFTREFSTLCSADIPMDDALRIVQAQTSLARLKTLAAALLADVLNGRPLSEAMHGQPRIFPADYVAVVRAGESGGRLAQVLSELAELLERRAEIRARIQSALIYPAMLIVLSLVTLAIIIGGVIPSMAPIFTQSGKPVPLTIQAMLALQAHWLEIVLASLAALALLGGSIGFAMTDAARRRRLDRLLLRLPLAGSFLLQQDTARFARTLGTMLSAGVPLIPATRSASEVVGNDHLRAGLEQAIEKVQQGTALHRALRETVALPAVALQMIAVGEEAGRLDRMLLRVAEMLEKQLQTRVDRFMAALTPAMTVGIALIIGALIMPVMTAVLSINDLAGR